jgi:DNA-binding NarL/FixJ family response regulator
MNATVLCGCDNKQFIQFFGRREPIASRRQAHDMENGMSNNSNTVFLASDGMPARNVYSRLTELCERHPTISAVVFSGQRELMLGALQVMFSGVKVLAEIHARDDASAPQLDKKQPAITRHRESPSDLRLTERQLDVLALMMQGKSNKAICRALNLAEPTVKNHVTAILRALKVSNRTEAVIAVAELGWKLPTTAQSDLKTENPRLPSPV